MIYSVTLAYQHHLLFILFLDTKEGGSDALAKAFNVLKKRAEDDESNVLFSVANDLAKVCIAGGYVVIMLNA